ncbi:stress responsive alpha-beta barrel domain protein [Actinidia rufa]|uniref:Stress responsive alpha-beta barrel domain protein n=1 Tax=Actinidia rufa TaxID=165716 RepID=A0A7J0DCY2_9ERIC|nr:stress responsive alpha-beta barrel domain protein [Actinidia rufa]
MLIQSHSFCLSGILPRTLGSANASFGGHISDPNIENYTHAFYMRFQRKEDLAKFYDNPFYLGVLKDYVMPYCHEFNYGVEFILLLEFLESALGTPVEEALASLAKLTTEFPSLIVQATQGSNFNLTNKDYTHGMVIRFRSLEAFEIFMGSSEYTDVRSHIHLFILY